ncbi:STAS-like domain-containing protein [Streptomyces sp. CA-146814]|uniref:STAS-like domain-containing protein n=1 Tax=Streptomyces sp. CA-146814 TaxID=3240053 RepID=UPI003D93566B
MTEEPNSTYTLHKLAGRYDVSDFLSAIKKSHDSGASSFVIDASDTRAIYPAGAAPTAAIIDHFRSEGMDVKFTNIPAGSFIERVRIRNPFVASKQNLNEPGSRLNTVWAYTEDSVFDLTNCVMEELAERIEFGNGVYAALNWCLFEVLDNVFQHSSNEVGFFMAQILKASNRLLLCVADAGIGVHRSFYVGGKYRPPTAFDAITLAVRQGVSSTGDKRGNGLYGLKGVIEANGGKLEIRSGRGYLQISPNGADGGETRGLVVNSNAHCTVVDFELKVGAPVNLGEVLGVPMQDLRLESIENEYGEHTIHLIDHAQGTGTRAAAERLRNFLMSYINDGAQYLILDFTGVPMVSSSFADETIGKLAERFGPVGFAQKFRLINMNPDVHMLLDRAIALRISAQYYRDDRVPNRK